MYNQRTVQGIKDLKMRSYTKIGDMKSLARRRELHRIDPRVKIFSNIKCRARRNGIPFEFKSSKELPDVPLICPMLKIPMFVGEGKSTDNSPTLDRIDNTNGYIKGNVQWLSRKANQMKSNANFKEVEMLYNFMKEQQDILQ